MNILDWAVIGIFVLFMCHGFAKGFIKSVFGLLSTIVSVAVSLYAYPIVSKALTNTDLYIRIKQSVMGFVNIDGIAQTQTASLQTDFISSLNLPPFLQRSAMSNNNPIVYGILKASGFEDYISGYFTTLIINVISILVVFIAVKIVLNIVELMLDTFSKLPVINLINRVSGLIVGIFQASVLVWVLLAALTLFFFSQNTEFMDLLHKSVIAHSFYDNNPILKFIADIKTHI